MELVTGDIWLMKADAKCITTNGCVASSGGLVMGRGIALQAREKFPTLQKALGSLVSDFGNRVFPLDTSGIYAPGYVLVSFPTKHEWYHSASLQLIETSAAQLAELIELRGWKSVLVAAPGCGNGKLRWKDVEPILDKHLGKYPVSCTVR